MGSKGCDWKRHPDWKVFSVSFSSYLLSSGKWKVEGAEEGVVKLRCGDRNEEGPGDCSVWVGKELRLKENLRLA